MNGAGAMHRAPVSPQARKASEREFRGLGASAAAALADRKFGPAVHAPALNADHPAPGLERDKTRRDKGLVGSHAEIVRDTKTDNVLLVQSTAALSLTGTDGAREPVDQRLRRSGPDYVPAASEVPVRIASDARDGVRFVDGGFSVAPVVAKNTADEADEDRIFWGSVAEDTDYIVRPLPSGAESLFQLRSKDSPETMRLKVDLPAGAHLEQAKAEHPIANDPPDSIAIVKGNDTLGYISAAKTLDSEGTVVETTTEIDRDEIVIRVDHQDRELLYPLLVDPQYWTRIGSCNGTGFGDWYFWQYVADPVSHFGAATCNGSYAPGVYLSMPTNTWFTRWDTARYSFQAPPGTYLYDTVFGNVSHNNPYYSKYYSGLLTPDASAWYTDVNTYNSTNGYTLGNPAEATYAFSGQILDSCFVPRCSDPGRASDERNWATFGITVTPPPTGSNYPSGGYLNTTNHNPNVAMGYTTVALGDRHNPKIENGPASSGWTNNNLKRTVNATATDEGLGVTSIRMTGGAQAAVTHPAPCSYFPQPGATPCRPSFTTPFEYTLNEGVNILTVQATDVVDNTSTEHTWTEKLDTTPPDAPAVDSISPNEGTAQAIWDAASDRVPSNGRESSGVASYQVRYRVAQGQFTDWKTYGSANRASDATPSADVDTTVTFEVRTVDAAGNPSAIATITDSVDGVAPDVDASGVLADAVGGYVAGTTRTLTVSGDDDSAGIGELRLEDQTGTLLSSQPMSCGPGSCPTSTSTDLSVDFGRFAEGSVTLTAAVVDAIKARSQDLDLDFVVDKTAPPAASNVHQVGASLDTTTVAWTEAPDPAIGEGTPGSGNLVRYRFKLLLDSDFGAWTSTDAGYAEIPVPPLVPFVVEVQSMDAVGNLGASTSETIVPVPDALVINESQQISDDINSATTSYEEVPDPDAPPAAAASAETRSTSAAANATDGDTREYGQPNPVYGDTLGGDAQTRGDSAHDDDVADAQQGLGAYNGCFYLLDSARAADVPGDPQHFTPERTRLGANAYFYCRPETGGDPGRITKVVVKAQLAIDHGGDDFQPIGLRHVVTLPYTSYKRIKQYPFNGIRNLCTPSAGGTHKFGILGVLQITYDFDGDLITRSTRIAAGSKTLTCPDAGERRYREASGFALLGHYNADVTSKSTQAPSKLLRNELGDQPYAPPTATAGPWHAHHIIPYRDRYNRVSRALAFRCRIPPNDKDNGLYLRGPGLRKTSKYSGRSRKAYKDLVAYDQSKTPQGTLYLRTYHADTLKDTYGYATQLAQRFYDTRAIAVDECGPGARDMMKGTDGQLAQAKSALARGGFGVEQLGH
jgi:hypothetical protein